MLSDLQLLSQADLIYFVGSSDNVDVLQAQHNANLQPHVAPSVVSQRYSESAPRIRVKLSHTHHQPTADILSKWTIAVSSFSHYLLTVGTCGRSVGAGT